MSAVYTPRPAPTLLAELDQLLTTQGQLLFAKTAYDPDQAEAFGVCLLDFMRRRGMEVRAKIAFQEDTQQQMGPLARAVVRARTPAEETAACKALAKWLNDDLDAALRDAQDGAQ